MRGGSKTIKPYWHDGAWVFDDPLRGLWAKFFVARTPEIVDQVLSRAGLRSRRPFTLHSATMRALGSGIGSFWSGCARTARAIGTGGEGWRGCAGADPVSLSHWSGSG